MVRRRCAIWRGLSRPALSTCAGVGRRISMVAECNITNSSTSGIASGALMGRNCKKKRKRKRSHIFNCNLSNPQGSKFIRFLHYAAPCNAIIALERQTRRVKISSFIPSFVFTSAFTALYVPERGTITLSCDSLTGSTCPRTKC